MEQIQDAHISSFPLYFSNITNEGGNNCQWRFKCNPLFLENPLRFYDQFLLQRNKIWKNTHIVWNHSKEHTKNQFLLESAYISSENLVLFRNS